MPPDPATAACHWAKAGPSSVVAVRGPAAVAFVDAFTTAALKPLAPGSGAEGFFADAKGHVLALATILRTDEGVRIVAWPGGVSLADHLERYHIREPIEITDESATLANIVVAGPAAVGVLAGLVGADVPRAPCGHAAATIAGVPVSIVAVDWAGPDGLLVLVPVASVATIAEALEAGGAVAAEPGLVERLRIERGWPAPADLLPKTLPQELGRDARAISFTKGCYLGQETVARLDALGHVNRRLAGIVSPAPLVAGAGVECDGGRVATVTSACPRPHGGWLGLALLPLRAAERGLFVEGRAVQAVELPLAAAAEAEPPPPSGRGGEVVFVAKRFNVVRIVEPDGGRVRDVVEHPGSVVVVPVVSRREVCLVEVVRVAVGRTLLELPAGTLDRVESPAAAAARELTEETGYRAGRMTSLGGLWMSPGILRERMHLFVAEDLAPGPQALEPGEQITVRVTPWAEAIAMCHDGRIEDAKTVAGLLRAAAWLERQGSGSAAGG